MSVLVTMLSPAAAEPAVPLADRGGQVTLGTGFEDAVAPLSLEGALPLRAVGRPVVVWVGATVPLLALDLRDHQAELGASLPLRDRPWDVRASAALREVSTANDAFTATSLGTVVRAAPGHYAPRWTVALEGQLWTAWATRLATTAFAEELGGALPYSAWSPLTATHGKLGARVGGLVGPLELGVRAGYETRGKLNLVIPPVYLDAHVGYRF
jgi:hypothetical protein